MDKSDIYMTAASMSITAALILWEDFGLMVTPTILTVVAAGCFLMAGRCWAKEEQLRTGKRKRR